MLDALARGVIVMFVRVFVYSLPSLMTDSSMQEWEVFGSAGVVKGLTCGAVRGSTWHALYPSHQWGAAAMMQWRATSEYPADLFLVPVLSAPKSGAQWTKKCDQFDESELVAQLPYLNEQTAHRHLLVAGKGLANLKNCKWFMEPETLLRRAMRFAYSAKVVLPASDYDTTRAKPRYGPAVLPYVPEPADDGVAPNLVSIPYPSSLHGPAFWGDRPYLMSFQGTLPQKGLRYENNTILQDKHYGAAVRERLVEICRDLDESKCLFDDLDSKSHYRRVASPHGECFDHLGLRGFRPESIDAVKAKSVFCLEPMGDSPYRKSLFDALAVGCIPVVFSLYAEITAPWHWGSWRNDSRIYVPEHKLFDASFDIVRFLENIPNATVRRMQNTIRRNNHKILFSIDTPHQPDAWDVLIERAHHEASKFERAHLPFPDNGHWLKVHTD